MEMDYKTLSGQSSGNKWGEKGRPGLSTRMRAHGGSRKNYLMPNHQFETSIIITDSGMDF